MEKTNVFLKNFSGTSYEVGTQIGNWILSAPDLLQSFASSKHLSPG